MAGTPVSVRPGALHPHPAPREDGAPGAFARNAPVGPSGAVAAAGPGDRPGRRLRGEPGAHDGPRRSRRLRRPGVRPRLRAGAGAAVLLRGAPCPLYDCQRSGLGAPVASRDDPGAHRRAPAGPHDSHESSAGVRKAVYPGGPVPGAAKAADRPGRVPERPASRRHDDGPYAGNSKTVLYY